MAIALDEFVRAIGDLAVSGDGTARPEMLSTDEIGQLVALVLGLSLH